MLELLIHSMEASVIVLIAVIAYRINILTHRHYQMAQVNDECLEQEQVTNTQAQDNKTKHEAESVIFKLLKGRAPKTDSYDTKIRALQRSQLFAGTQLINIKRQFGSLEKQNLEWLREACALYLIGAINHITNIERCSADSRDEVTLLALKSCLNISKEEAYQFHYKALRCNDESDMLSTIRSGEAAAKKWLSDEVVPSKLSLSHQLENWGVFA